MNARGKLNVAFVNGAVIVAVVLGLATNSFIVFLVALAVLLVSQFASGGIRYQGPKSGRN
jgi:hypothetical protein